MRPIRRPSIPTPPLARRTRFRSARGLRRSLGLSVSSRRSTTGKTGRARRSFSLAGRLLPPRSGTRSRSAGTRAAVSDAGRLSPTPSPPLSVGRSRSPKSARSRSRAASPRPRAIPVAERAPERRIRAPTRPPLSTPPLARRKTVAKESPRKRGLFLSFGTPISWAWAFEMKIKSTPIACVLRPTPIHPPIPQKKSNKSAKNPLKIRHNKASHSQKSLYTRGRGREQLSHLHHVSLTRIRYSGIIASVRGREAQLATGGCLARARDIEVELDGKLDFR